MGDIQLNDQKWQSLHKRQIQQNRWKSFRLLVLASKSALKWIKNNCCAKIIRGLGKTIWCLLVVMADLPLPQQIFGLLILPSKILMASNVVWQLLLVQDFEPKAWHHYTRFQTTWIKNFEKNLNETFLSPKWTIFWKASTSYFCQKALD